MLRVFESTNSARYECHNRLVMSAMKMAKEMYLCVLHTCSPCSEKLAGTLGKTFTFCANRIKHIHTMTVVKVFFFFFEF